MKDDFRNQIVIVSGASSGVGQSLALLIEVREAKVATAYALKDLTIPLKHLKG